MIYTLLDFFSKKFREIFYKIVKTLHLRRVTKKGVQIKNPLKKKKYRHYKTIHYTFLKELIIRKTLITYVDIGPKNLNTKPPYHHKMITFIIHP